MNHALRCLTLVSATLLSTAAQTEPFEFSGYVGTDLSYFPTSGLHAGQLDDLQHGLVLAPEFRWWSDSRDTQVKVSAFGRVDSADSKRQHLDLREGYIRHEFEDFTALIGVNKVFWGVAESRRLVDVINQIDQLEYTDKDARLGQPMLAQFTAK